MYKIKRLKNNHLENIHLQKQLKEWEHLKKQCEDYNIISNWFSRIITFNLYLILICLLSFGTMYGMGLSKSVDARIYFWIEMADVWVYGCNDAKHSMARLVLSKLANGLIPSCADAHLTLEKATTFLAQITVGTFFGVQTIRTYRPYIWYKVRLGVLNSIGTPCTPPHLI